ncbi:DUF420 domain-containing protein [Aquirufa rosea]|uniref:DUF420 domain-containing protein n=2 Tax=Aquirufa rosea TaxID=2509241 RepID=A0A4Q1C1V7_9BACT|nr:DUF420 domain-containing protein [Aquirufa rosea]
MPTYKIENTAKNNQIVNILSLAIPVAVALLNAIQTKIDLGTWTKVLPHVNGVLNATCSIILILGLIAIKNKNIELHRKLMGVAFVLGSLFLVSYVTYHISNEPTKFGGSGWLRPTYYILLFSHILLSIGVVRLVLKAIFYAMTDQIGAHKKLVKWTFPIWLYVSISGVLVYILIAPYYV